jgi:hypothetical protein
MQDASSRPAGAARDQFVGRLAVAGHKQGWPFDLPED